MTYSCTYYVYIYICVYFSECKCTCVSMYAVLPHEYFFMYKM